MSYEGSISIGNTEMDYVVFGKGDKTLVIIPGLGDGLRTVKGTGLALKNFLKIFVKDFKVYVFSRNRVLEQGYSIKDMAKDLKFALDKLGIKKASLFGISQGGMISQQFAINYPEVVERLALGVTVSRQNETVQKVVKSWIKMAEDKDYGSLITDTMEKTYTEKHMKKYKWLLPVLTRVGKPKSYERFIIQANACITHDAYDELNKIQCPTLVIGGDADKVVGENSSEEMAEKIKDCELIMYKGLGHGAYEEDKDFHQQILKFLSK